MPLERLALLRERFGEHAHRLGHECIRVLDRLARLVDDPVWIAAACCSNVSTG